MGRMIALQGIKRFVATLVLGSVAAWLVVLIASVALLVGTDRDFERAFIAACTTGVVALLVATIFSEAGALRIGPTRNAILAGDAIGDKDPESVDPRKPWGGPALFWTFLLVSAQLAAVVFFLSA